MSADSALAALNTMPVGEAKEQLTKCCGAWAWVRSVLDARPFLDVAELVAASDAAFDNFVREDWLEAFSHHPKIGDIDSLRTRFASTANWAGGEQAGAASADEATLQALAEGNSAYEEKFGYIFIICATGRSAAEMLAALQERMHNDEATELQIAASQQRQITALRIDKMLTSEIQAPEIPPPVIDVPRIPPPDLDAIPDPNL